MGALGAAGLAAHSFVDGLGIGLAFDISTSTGILVFLAVIAHDFADGLNTVGFVLRQSGDRRPPSAGCCSTRSPPLVGAIVGSSLSISEHSLGALLAVYAGFFLFMGGTDLLPHAHEHPSGRRVLLTLAGFAAVLALSLVARGASPRPTMASRGTGTTTKVGHRAGRARALALVLGLTAVLTVVEVVGGICTDSLALLADAGHMLSDARQPGSRSSRSGSPAGPPRRAQLRLQACRDPRGARERARARRRRALDPRRGATAGSTTRRTCSAAGCSPSRSVGLAVNLGRRLILLRSERHSLNVQAALRHVLADLLGSLGVIVAAVLDPHDRVEAGRSAGLAAIALLVLASSWGVLRESVSILLEAAPRGIDANEVEGAIVAAPGVVSVHDLHVWTITSGFPALSAHVLVGEGEDCHARRRELEALLSRRFRIDHTTLQVEHAQAELLHIRGSRALSAELLAGELAEPLARAVVRAERLVLGVGRVGGDLGRDRPHLLRDRLAVARDRCSRSSTQVSLPS